MSHRYNAKRSYWRDVAKDTLDVIQKGYYRNQRKESIFIKRDIDFTLSNTKLYRPGTNQYHVASLKKDIKQICDEDEDIFINYNHFEEEEEDEDAETLNILMYARNLIRRNQTNTSSTSLSKKTTTTEINILQDTTLTCALDIAYWDEKENIDRENQQQRQQPCTIGILNFASAKNPGGGFLNGACAQEESITRSSALYSSLTSKIASRYYSSNKLCRSPIYTDHIIYSPRVPIFKDDKNGIVLDEPYFCNIITAPAVNCGVLYTQNKVWETTREYTRYNDTYHHDNQYSKGNKNINNNNNNDNHFRKYNVKRKQHINKKKHNDVRCIMYQRAARILFIAAQNECDVLVLGAWGTGVFKNSPVDVAEMWYRLLCKSPDSENEYDGVFEHVFKRVVFAIPDQKTLIQFQNTFKFYCGGGDGDDGAYIHAT